MFIGVADTFQATTLTVCTGYSLRFQRSVVRVRFRGRLSR